MDTANVQSGTKDDWISIERVFTFRLVLKLPSWIFQIVLYISKERRVLSLRPFIGHETRTSNKCDGAMQIKLFFNSTYNYDNRSVWEESRHTNIVTHFTQNSSKVETP